VRVITVASRKGGSLKTTLTRHLAVEAERAGAGSVAIVDTDPMRGLTLWWEARKVDTPLLIDISGGLNGALAAAQRAHVDVLIIDTPPSIADIVIASIASADIVLIPCQPSPDDVRAMISTVAAVKEAGKPFAFVVARTKPNVRATAEVTATLSRYGPVVALLADRVLYASSATDGRTASEIEPGGAAAAEIGALWTYIANTLTEGQGAAA